MSMMQPDGSGMPQDQPDQGGSGANDPLEMIRHAVELIQGAQVQLQDDKMSGTLAKVTQQLYAALHGQQQENDQLIGNPSLQRALRRSG